MPKKVKKKKSDSAEDVTVTEAEAGIPSDAPPPKPKKKLDSKSQALLEAVNESNAEDNARRDSQLNDNALKLGDALDRIAMLEARVAELEKRATEDKATQQQFNQQIENYAKEELERRIGAVMSQLETATSKLTMISSHMQPRPAGQNAPPTSVAALTQQVAAMKVSK